MTKPRTNRRIESGVFMGSLSQIGLDVPCGTSIQGMYHMVHRGDQVSNRETMDLTDLAESCLGAFVRSGTLDLSLDQLAREVGISKRMLVHYFGGRDAIEARAMTLLENRLRAQFAPENFPAGVGIKVVID